MRKLVVITQGADGQTYEFVFDVVDTFMIPFLMNKHGLNDYKVLKVEQRNIKFY